MTTPSAIALDTSAVVAVAVGEPDAAGIVRCMAGMELLIGAPTLLEVGMALSTRMKDRGRGFLGDFLKWPRLRVVAFDAEMARLAQDAFDRYGRGQGGGAKLNFGDCLSYAVASRQNVPLLFKGHGFMLTDILAAYRPS